MQRIGQSITEQEALAVIYKNLRMGTDGIIDLLPYVREQTLRSAMTLQLDGYEKYAATVRVLLEECGALPKEAMGERLAAKMGAAWRGMLGITQSELAAILIEGSNACVTEMTRLCNHLEAPCGECTRLARELIELETHHVEALKAYL